LVGASLRGRRWHPRFLRATEVLALATTDQEVGSEKPVPVRSISLDTGASRVVGTFPAFRCRGAADGGTSDAGPDASGSPAEGDIWELSLQTEEDMGVTPDGRGLCLTRLDRNLNMADLMLSQRMDLATGSVESVLVLGGDRCPAAPGVTVTKQDPCRGRRALQKPAVRSSPFRFDRGKIIRRDPAGDRTVAVLKQFTMNERSSPSGRWLLVSRHVEEDEGDYIYRQIALLDLASGQLYPLSKTASPWPAPFDLARFKPSVAAEQTATLAGESDLAWLPFAGGDVLVLDNTLVVPERASVPLPGDVAR
jgi:hypothetical protein